MLKSWPKERAKGKRKEKLAKKAFWQSGDTRKQRSKIHMPRLPRFTTLKRGLASLPPRFLAALGCSPKSAAPNTLCHEGASHTLPKTHASSTFPGREASLAGTWCQPTSSAGQGEATQDRGSARHRISTSATGSQAILNESHKNKPFASAFRLVKRG